MAEKEKGRLSEVLGQPIVMTQPTVRDGNAVKVRTEAAGMSAPERIVFDVETSRILQILQPRFTISPKASFVRMLRTPMTPSLCDAQRKG